MRRLDAELDGDACAWSSRFIHEIDIQRVFERHIVRMIVRYVRFTQFEPILSTLSPTLNLCLMSNHCAHGALLPAAIFIYDLRVLSQKANSFFQPSTACS